MAGFRPGSCCPGLFTPMWFVRATQAKLWVGFAAFIWPTAKRLCARHSCVLTHIGTCRTDFFCWLHRCAVDVACAVSLRAFSRFSCRLTYTQKILCLTFWKQIVLSYVKGLWLPQMLNLAPGATSEGRTQQSSSSLTNLRCPTGVAGACSRVLNHNTHTHTQTFPHLQPHWLISWDRPRPVLRPGCCWWVTVANLSHLGWDTCPFCTLLPFPSCLWVCLDGAGP